jgi:hypothetical protein
MRNPALTNFSRSFRPFRSLQVGQWRPLSALARNLEKFLPAADAEILDWIESITLEGLSDLFDRQVMLRLEIQDSANAAFGRGQHRTRCYQPNAPHNSVELYQRLGLFERVR